LIGNEPEGGGQHILPFSRLDSHRCLLSKSVRLNGMNVHSFSKIMELGKIVKRYGLFFRKKSKASLPKNRQEKYNKAVAKLQYATHSQPEGARK
jgi:hypothetical protein